MTLIPGSLANAPSDALQPSVKGVFTLRESGNFMSRDPINPEALAVAGHHVRFDGEDFAEVVDAGREIPDAEMIHCSEAANSTVSLHVAQNPPTLAKFRVLVHHHSPFRFQFPNRHGTQAFRGRKSSRRAASFPWFLGPLARAVRANRASG